MRYTRREYTTLVDAYQTLRYYIESLGGDARTLDNLSDMIEGYKPRWGEKKLRAGQQKNRRTLDAYVRTPPA